MRSFALRVREGGRQERSLFATRELHIGIRRGWSAGSRILFVAKRAQAAGGDLAPAVVIGAGTLARVVELGDLADEEEKKLCLQNNWYGKMVFSSLARFLPAFPVSQVASLAGAPAALLHGLEIDGGAAAAASALARAKIVT